MPSHPGNPADTRIDGRTEQLGVSPAPLLATSYVAFESLEPQAPSPIAGQLRIPTRDDGPLAAVIIVHGSVGLDSRGQLYADALNRAGIATLEVDLWAARAWVGSRRGRPEGVPETLPDVYAALYYLANLHDIDAQRICILGFSWGGVVAMLTATKPYAQRYAPVQLGFKAHAAFYPVCWVYNKLPGYEFKQFTGAPVLIQAGELDTYDEPDTCAKLVASLPPEARAFITVEVYSGATHAFNRLEPEITVDDPFSHLGRGGEVTFTPNPEVTAVSLTTTVNFFEQAGVGKLGF